MKLGVNPPRAIRLSSRKGCALLAYVAMQPDKRVDREELAGLLWGDHSDRHARQALRQCLASLREELGPHCSDLLVLEEGKVGLRSQLLTVDTIAFTWLCESSELPDIERAVGLYAGHFLADLKVREEPFEDWAGAERSRLAGLAAHTFATYAGRMSALGNGRQAIAAVERLVAFDPLREDWQRLMLRLLVCHRGREAALAQGRKFAELLKRELDVAPEAASLALIDAITDGTVGPISPRNSAASQAGGGHVLPVQVTPAGVLPAMQAPAMQALTGATESEDSSNQTGLLAAPSAYPASRKFSARGLATAGLVVLAAIGGVLWIGPTRHSGSPELDAAKNVAVADGAIIPLLVMPLIANGSESDQRTADTITDDLIYHLAHFSGLRVVSRDTAYSYKGKVMDAADLGKIFGVHYVMQGRVSSLGALTRVTVELVDTNSRLTVWANRGETDLTNIADIPDIIVKRLTRKLQVESTYAESRTAKAADELPIATLLAKALAAQYGGQNAESVQKALSLYEEALRRQPDLVLAMVGVAAQLITARTNYLTAPEPDLDRSEKLLNRAVQLDPEAERAYYWLGQLQQAKGDYSQALVSLRRAVEINASFAPALAHAGHVLVRLGKPAEGLVSIEQAIHLEPKGPVTRFGSRYAGEAELELGHYQAAIGRLKQAEALDPDNPLGHAVLAATYALMGEASAAGIEAAKFKSLANAELVSDLLQQLHSRHTNGYRLHFLDGLELALSLSP